MRRAGPPFALVDELRTDVVPVEDVVPLRAAPAGVDVPELLDLLKLLVPIAVIGEVRFQDGAGWSSTAAQLSFGKSTDE